MHAGGSDGYIGLSNDWTFVKLTCKASVSLLSELGLQRDIQIKIAASPAAWGVVTFKLQTN